MKYSASGSAHKTISNQIKHEIKVEGKALGKSGKKELKARVASRLEANKKLDTFIIDTGDNSSKDIIIGTKNWLDYNINTWLYDD